MNHVTRTVQDTPGGTLVRTEERETPGAASHTRSEAPAFMLFVRKSVGAPVTVSEKVDTLGTMCVVLINGALDEEDVKTGHVLHIGQPAWMTGSSESLRAETIVRETLRQQNWELYLDGHTLTLTYEGAVVLA